MAGTLALLLIAGLALPIFLMRSAGPFMLSIPAAVSERTSGLAPALLAALVVSQFLNPHGLFHLDAKVPAVLVAAGLAAIRAPFITSIIGGALVAAVLRALFHF